MTPHASSPAPPLGHPDSVPSFVLTTPWFPVFFSIQAAATLGNGAAQLLFPAQAKPNHFPRLETDWTYKEPVEIVTDAFNPAPGVSVPPSPERGNEWFGTYLIFIRIPRLYPVFVSSLSCMFWQWEQVCVHLPQPTWWDRLWHGKVLGRDLYSTLLARAWREGRGSDDKARLEAIRRRLGYLGPLTVLLGPGPDSGVSQGILMD